MSKKSSNDKMYELIKCDGTTQTMSRAEAAKEMDAISLQWETEELEDGRIMAYGVYDWDFRTTEKGTELLIPKLRGEDIYVPLNEVASKMLGDDVHGSVFVYEDDED